MNEVQRTNLFEKQNLLLRGPISLFDKLTGQSDESRIEDVNKKWAKQFGAVAAAESALGEFRTRASATEVSRKQQEDNMQLLKSSLFSPEFLGTDTWGAAAKGLMFQAAGAVAGPQRISDAIQRALGLQPQLNPLTDKTDYRTPAEIRRADLLRLSQRKNLSADERELARLRIEESFLGSLQPQSHSVPHEGIGATQGRFLTRGGGNLASPELNALNRIDKNVQAFKEVHQQIERMLRKFGPVPVAEHL